ncbi:hypothetical protein [Streptomyces sp. NBC_01353]|uniref:hypothetical protein n=1 Tax=Streptomyces sp. NBC_01353 TaxID=2903835 RepID=UPI002E347D39|nr:hypothetical protein [Streptomyces sp. NBC_01353]
MAEAMDGGGGAISPLSTMSMFGGVVGAAAAAASLAVEVNELANLKNRVDQLLKDFQGSHAGPGKIAADWLDKGALAGEGFKEAEFLFSSYDVVREELLKFSKVLGLQMESMKIAIDFSKTGYENIDDDIRARMRSLNTQITDLQKREGDDGGDRRAMGGASQTEVPQTAAPTDGGDGTQGGL